MQPYGCINRINNIDIKKEVKNEKINVVFDGFGFVYGFSEFGS